MAGPVFSSDPVCPGRPAFDARNTIFRAVFRGIFREAGVVRLGLGQARNDGLDFSAWPWLGFLVPVLLSTEGGKEDSESSSGMFSEPLSMGWSRSSRGSDRGSGRVAHSGDLGLD